MGDHRAEVHITLQLHGKTYRGDWDWINYGGFDEGIDSRIRDWFLDSWNDALRRYEAMLEEADAPRRLREMERAERAELVRLRLKYPEG